MKWFGEPWNCGVCDPATKADTPVYRFCEHCERPIMPKDQGVIFPRADDPLWVIAHLDCFLHSIGALPCSPKVHPPTKETLS